MRYALHRPGEVASEHLQSLTADFDPCLREFNPDAAFNKELKRRQRWHDASTGAEIVKYVVSGEWWIDFSEELADGLHL